MKNQLKKIIEQPYMSKQGKLSFIQRMILVHSYIYYELNYNVLTDKEYDDLMVTYSNLQQWTNKKELLETEYGYVFYDFSNATGFDLYSRLLEADKEKIVNLSTTIVYLEKGDKRK